MFKQMSLGQKFNKQKLYKKAQIQSSRKRTGRKLI